MERVTLGTKVFARSEKLEKLLKSAENAGIEEVIVADDGDRDDRSHIYSRNYDFELQVIDLEYDAGLGEGRAEIVDAADTEYILIVDTDHQIPENIDNLVQILDGDESIGAVSGLLLEEGTISGMLHDFDFQDGYLIRDLNRPKEVEQIDGIPFIPYDLIPNAALFRVDVFADYNWDREFVIEGEHEDFYLGHLDTDWRFGVTPSVIFPHDSGGSDSYLLERFKPSKDRESREYLLNKHDIKGIIPKDLALWDGPLPDMAYEVLPTSVQYYLISSARTTLIRARYVLNRVFS